MKKIKLTNERKKGTELTIFIICATIVIFCLFFLFYFEYSFNQEKDEEVGLDINSGNVYKMDINEARKLIESYQYPNILANGDSFNSMTYYYSKDKVLVSELSDEAKFLIAINNSLESYYCNDESNICYLNEEIVKQKYNELFTDEYKYYENDYLTKEDNVLRIEPWNTYSNGFVYTNITDAIYNETTLRIYVKVAFQYDSTLYYNYDLTNVIEEISSCESNDDLDKYDNLNSYVYTFNIEDGNYFLYSVEKQ